jgi:hypothetical protein
LRRCVDKVAVEGEGEGEECAAVQIKTCEVCYFHNVAGRCRRGDGHGLRPTVQEGIKAEILDRAKNETRQFEVVNSNPLADTLLFWLGV